VKVVQGRAFDYCFYSIHTRSFGLEASTRFRNYARVKRKADRDVLAGWTFQTFPTSETPYGNRPVRTASTVPVENKPKTLDAWPLEALRKISKCRIGIAIGNGNRKVPYFEPNGPKGPMIDEVHFVGARLNTRLRRSGLNRIARGVFALPLFKVKQ